MDFSVRYTQEQEEFRQQVSKWVEDNVPIALRHRSDLYHEPLDVYLEQRELGRRLGAMGWLFPTAPREYGGGGMDLDAALVIMEELNKLGVSLPPYYDSGGVLGSAAIQVWGTEEQRQRYLPQIYSGAVRTWQLLTEPAAGSDLASVQTTAVRDGDDYLLRGQKVYIGSEHGADAYWTIARTSDGPRHKNLGWFMIDGEAAGLTVQPMHLIGDMDKNTVFLDDVRVPAISLIGGADNGWAVATTHLDLEHGFRSDFILGHRGRGHLDRLIDYSRGAMRNGAPLLADPYRRDLLAQAYIKHEIQRQWGLRNYWLATSQRAQTYEGAQAYFFEKVTGMWMNRVIAEIAGPSGLVWSDGVGAGGGSLGRRQGASIGESHGGGTIDIQRVVMARRLGIGRAGGEPGAALA